MAQLEAAKQEYAAGEARLAAVQPIYNTVKPLYDRYLQTQQQYDAAVAAGDTGRSIALWAAVEAQRAAYESQLGDSGYSISSLIDRRLDSEQDVEQETNTIPCKILDGMSVDDAVKLDGILKTLKLNGNASVASAAEALERAVLEYTIEF